jgi:hypothetical protein
MSLGVASTGCPTKEKVISDAKRVRRAMEEITEILNPPEFEAKARNVFALNEAGKLLLEKFQIFRFVYKTIWPDEKILPADKRADAEEVIGKPIHTNLEAVIAIPKRLLEGTNELCLEIIQRFHGGGGVSIQCSRLMTSANHYRHVGRRCSIHGHTSMTSNIYWRATEP